MRKRARFLMKSSLEERVVLFFFFVSRRGRERGRERKREREEERESVWPDAAASSLKDVR